MYGVMGVRAAHLGSGKGKNLWKPSIQFKPIHRKLERRNRTYLKERKDAIYSLHLAVAKAR